MPDEPDVPLEPEVPALWDDAVLPFADLDLSLSPRARADPLANATIVVNTRAGASLRIWASFK
jgi:hypothetical protein